MCPDKSLLSALYDGELRKEEKNRVEAHLTGCEDCRRIYEGFVSQSGLLKQEVEPEYHVSFENVQRMIRHKKNVDKVRFFPGSLGSFVFPGAVAAAAVIAFLAGGAVSVENEGAPSFSSMPLGISRSWSVPPGDFVVPGNDLDAVLSSIDRQNSSMFGQEADIELPGDLNLAMLGESQLVPADSTEVSFSK